MSESAYVKDVDTSTFLAEVLHRSKTVPVVVDFWAPWCGPCRVLGPILEAEIEALGGRVLLAKLNTDQSPELAQQFGIQGIPAVKAFRDGKVVAEFVGAVPRPQVQKFLKALAPAPALSALDQAEAALGAGRHAEAAQLLAPLLADPEVGNKARLALVRAHIGAGQADAARAEMAKIDPRSAEALTLPTLERLLGFGDDARAYGGEDKARAAVAANPKDAQAHYALASALAARGEVAEALEHFLEVVGRDRKLKDDGARLAMLALFEQLGSEHELTQRYRRQLQIVL